jgi:hypothetical protein
MDAMFSVRILRNGQWRCPDALAIPRADRSGIAGLMAPATDQDRVGDAADEFFTGVQRAAGVVVVPMVAPAGHMAAIAKAISIAIELQVKTIVVKSYAKMSSSSLMDVLHRFN